MPQLDLFSYFSAATVLIILFSKELIIVNPEVMLNKHIYINVTEKSKYAIITQ